MTHWYPSAFYLSLWREIYKCRSNLQEGTQCLVPQSVCMCACVRERDTGLVFLGCCWHRFFFFFFFSVLWKGKQGSLRPCCIMGNWWILSEVQQCNLLFHILTLLSTNTFGEQCLQGQLSLLVLLLRFMNVVVLNCDWMIAANKGRETCFMLQELACRGLLNCNLFPQHPFKCHCV